MCFLTDPEEEKGIVPIYTIKGNSVEHEVMVLPTLGFPTGLGVAKSSLGHPIHAFPLIFIFSHYYGVILDLLFSDLRAVLVKPIPKHTLVSPGPYFSSGKFFKLPRHKSPVSIRKPYLLFMGTLTHPQ